MKVAMSSLLFSNQPIEDALSTLSEMDYKYIELGALQDWCHIQPKEVYENPTREYKKIAQLITDLKLEIVALNTGFGNKERQRFEALAELASKLKVPVITLPSGPKNSTISNEIKRLTPLLTISKKYGIQLTIETHVGTFTEQPEMAYQLVKSLPELALTLDISHYYCNYLEEEAEKLIPYVHHVHFRDCGRGWDNIQLPYGKGLLDITKWIQLLQKSNYTGNITIEYIDLPGTKFDHIEAATLCASKCNEILEGIIHG